MAARRRRTKPAMPAVERPGDEVVLGVGVGIAGVEVVRADVVAGLDAPLGIADDVDAAGAAAGGVVAL